MSNWQIMLVTVASIFCCRGMELCSNVLPVAILCWLQRPVNLFTLVNANKWLLLRCKIGIHGMHCLARLLWHKSFYFNLMLVNFWLLDFFPQLSALYKIFMLVIKTLILNFRISICNILLNPLKKIIYKLDFLKTRQAFLISLELG